MVPPQDRPANARLMVHQTLKPVPIDDESARLLFGDASPAELARLTARPLYPLPGRLLALLDGHVPGWLTGDERRRAGVVSAVCDRAGAAAVFHGMLVRHPNHPPPVDPSMTDEQFARSGAGELINRATFDQFHRRQWEVTAIVRARREAYLGWLTTNPVYLAERDALRSRSAGVVGRLKRIPARKRSRLAWEGKEAGRDSGDEDTRAAFNVFYDRWDLVGLITWDMPCPTQPNLGMPAVLGQFLGLDDRPAVQLPRTFRLPARFSLHDLLIEPLEPHLSEWHAVEEQEHPSDLNYSRWRRIYHLNLLRNVILLGTYPDHFHRKAGVLDEVFAAYFGDVGAESVRKSRLSIEGRLAGGGGPPARDGK